MIVPIYRQGNGDSACYSKLLKVTHLWNTNPKHLAPERSLSSFSPLTLQSESQILLIQPFEPLHILFAFRGQMPPPLFTCPGLDLLSKLGSYPRVPRLYLQTSVSPFVALAENRLHLAHHLVSQATILPNALSHSLSFCV